MQILFVPPATDAAKNTCTDFPPPPFFPRHFISGGVFANAPPPPPLLPLSLIMWKPAQLHLCLMCAVLYTALQLVVVFLLPLSSSFPFWRKSQKIVPPFLSPLSFLSPHAPARPISALQLHFALPQKCARAFKGERKRERGEEGVY